LRAKPRLGRSPAAAITIVVTSLSALIAVARAGHAPPPPFRSPFDAAYSPDGRLLAVTDRTAGCVEIMTAASGRSVRRISVSEPAGLTWTPSGNRLYVAESGADTAAEIDPRAGRVVRRMSVGCRPMGVALCSARRLLLVACASSRCLSVVDPATGRERARIACPAETFAVVTVPHTSIAAVGNLIPGVSATDPSTSCAVSLIDLGTLRRIADVRLPAGSTVLRGLAASPDGRWVYAVHTLARFQMPTTQLDRGWTNTNALSIVDVAGRRVYATVLLDSVFEGAADPWGVVVSHDGATMWITLSGAQQLARIDLARLHRYLAGGIPADSPLLRPSAEYSATSTDAWAEIARDPSRRTILSSDLSAMYAADLLTRTDLPGNGPRGLSVSPDGKRLAVAMYFSGTVELVDPAICKPRANVTLLPSRSPDRARLGERLFHDGTLCFQHWLSCATCHPDGRADGLNWDLLNDGIGNPKNTQSLLYAHRRSPVMWQGVRANLRVATVAGFRSIEHREPQPGEVEAIDAYIAAMRPEPSPYLKPAPHPRPLSLNEGEGRAAPHPRPPMSLNEGEGRALFESRATRCATCHSGPMLTDQKLHDVGTRGELDNTSEFVTPPLREVWRTAPYLHDGRAASMRDVLTRFKRSGRHGVTSGLSARQLDDLAEYVLSL